MSLFARIKTFIGNLRLRERMLFIYIAGGILPILLLDIYTYQNTRSVLIQKAKESEMDGLNMIADSMSESMSVISDISKQMYFDEKIEHIAFHQYENYSEILADYRDYDTISDYLKYYYHEISSITLYLNNDTISNNEYFVHVDQEIAEKPWYQNTLELNGKPYWSYSYLVYNDTVVLHRNEYERDTDEMILLLKQIKDDTYSGKVRFQGEDTCLLSTVRVKPDYSDDYYTLVSVCPYEEIAGSAARSALGSLVPQLVCVVSGLGIILVFSNQFSTRVNTFRLQMHKAATGDFDITEDIGGEDEISDLYRDLKVMIDSIQELMNNVIKERVQKEQVNARQKEVEFKMLASQINPHFLYNTLETIRMQARIHNQPDIEELAKMLAKIMRRNIQVSNTLQPLKSELKLVEYYLKIQDYRFHDRIHYRIETEGDIEPLKVMPLLIQPFVENAFVHGLEAKESGGEIVIRVEVRSHLWITVTDNGCGMSMEKLDEVRRGLNDFENLDRTHIGICNVNQRIKLQYGEDYGVEFESKTGAGTKVCIKLPVLTSEIM